MTVIFNEDDLPDRWSMVVAARASVVDTAPDFCGWRSLTTENAAASAGAPFLGLDSTMVSMEFELDSITAVLQRGVFLVQISDLAVTRVPAWWGWDH